MGSNNNVNGRRESDNSDEYNLKIPIVGYEVMDERARFTVFKLRVENEKLGESYLVFRRYTDFVRLHNKLKEEFPTSHIPLPPKRWLRDNFDMTFLEDRMKGLQALVDSILLMQPNLTESSTVREFFCLDEPPVYPETAEESRSMYGTVEENVMHLKQQLSNKELEIEILKAELALLTNQRDNLLKYAKTCRSCSQRYSFISCDSPSENLLRNNNNRTPTPQNQEKSSPSLNTSRKQRNSIDDQSSSSSLSSNDKSLQSSPKHEGRHGPLQNGYLEPVIEDDKMSSTSSATLTDSTQSQNLATLAIS